MTRSLALVGLSVALVASCTLDRGGLLGGNDGGGPSTTTSSVGGATGSGGATTTSTGNPTAGGETPGVENCLNGVDDDGDGFADCADSDCNAGYICVPSAPSADAYVTPTTDPGSCPPDAPAKTTSQCGACSCLAQAGTCALGGQLHTGNTLSCAGTSTVSFTAPRACNNGPSGDRSINVSISAPNNDGSCQPASLTTTAQTVSICAASAAGSCSDANQICVPATNDACVLVMAQSCPAAYPVERSVLFGESAASCDCSCAKSGETCSPTVEVSGSDGCPNATSIALNPSGCTSLGSIQSWRVPPQPSTVACEPSATPPGNPSRFRLCCLM